MNTLRLCSAADSIPAPVVSAASPWLLRTNRSPMHVLSMRPQERDIANDDAVFRPEPSGIAHLEQAFVPGDLVLFAGQGFESRWIALVTCHPLELLLGRWFSHIGICARDQQGRVLVFESTTLCEQPCEIQHRMFCGTQAHLPAQRVANYPGKIWRLRLAERETLADSQSQRLSDFLISEIGRPYDYAGAMISATWRLRLSSWLYPTLQRMFCSYYVMAALKDIGKVDKDLNPRAFNPARVARDLQAWGSYQPLCRRGSESVRLR